MRFTCWVWSWLTCICQGTLCLDELLLCGVVRRLLGRQLLCLGVIYVGLDRLLVVLRGPVPSLALGLSDDEATMGSLFRLAHVLLCLDAIEGEVVGVLWRLGVP